VPEPAPSKLSHVDLVVSDIGRSLEFYRGLLVPLGWTELNEVRGERGETIHYISQAGRGWRCSAEWLSGAGTTIESGPEEYEYTPGYYAVFFYDPDGIKLELLHRPGYWEYIRG
jgi:catechol 2,3-dioxygenase-like lactoylglutathione lyase family enzyme